MDDEGRDGYDDAARSRSVSLRSRLDCRGPRPLPLSPLSPPLPPTHTYTHSPKTLDCTMMASSTTSSYSSACFNLFCSLFSSTLGAHLLDSLEVCGEHAAFRTPQLPCSWCVGDWTPPPPSATRRRKILGRSPRFPAQDPLCTPSLLSAPELPWVSPFTPQLRESPSTWTSRATPPVTTTPSHRL